jgi:6-phosphogluconolactonase/glucosamine-6-phosphate isomerase/deaminase
MQFINTIDNKDGIQALADKIVSFIKEGNNVLWLIAGGSNLPIAAEVMKIIRGSINQDLLPKLVISLIDERYGPAGHPDSNWKQLQDTGINLDGIKANYILDDSSLEETTIRFGENIKKILASTDVIVGQFGMGADGHIAGIMPHSPTISEEVLPTAGYESKPFTRVSLTFPILRKINVAYMFVAIDTKKDAIELLKTDNVSLDIEPAQILKEIPEVYVYVRQ